MVPDRAWSTGVWFKFHDLCVTQGESIPGERGAISDALNRQIFEGVELGNALNGPLCKV